MHLNDSMIFSECISHTLQCLLELLICERRMFEHVRLWLCSFPFDFLAKHLLCGKSCCLCAKLRFKVFLIYLVIDSKVKRVDIEGDSFDEASKIWTISNLSYSFQAPSRTKVVYIVE